MLNIHTYKGRPPGRLFCDFLESNAFFVATVSEKLHSSHAEG